VLNIREAQMAALRDAKRREFIVAAAADLRGKFPARLGSTPDSELHAQIAAGIQEAAAFDITDATDVGFYLACRVEYRPDFGRSPETSWARAILEQEDLDGREKIEALGRAALFRKPPVHG
jgi:hypothetical protein